MPTELTPHHRTWRIRVFAATWLSYVGFYFCRRPFSAAKSAIGSEYGWDTETLGNIYACYLFAYAVGQFLASRMGTALGPRKNVLIGMAVSTLATLAMGVTPSVPMMMGLIAVNGLAQATGWSGNVGTMASWFHKHERGRVMGLWSTNFTVGALVSGWVMAWALALNATVPDTWRWVTDFTPKFDWPSQSWRTCFYIGAGVLAAVWLQFYFFQRSKPEDVGLAAIDDPTTAVDESLKPDEPEKLSRDAWVTLFLVAGFYFFSKLVRYAIWSWVPFFLTETYKKSSAEANVYATIFDVAGIVGVWASGYLSDRYFGSKRSGISLIMMIGMVLSTLALVMFGSLSVTVFTIILAGVGFTLYGPDALLSGAAAIDIGGRKNATFAAAVISGVGSCGPIVQELVISRSYDPKKGDLDVVFGLLFTCAICAMLFCLALVIRNRKSGKGV